MASGGLLRLLDAYIAIGGDTSGYDAALTRAEAKAKASGDRISGLFTPSKVFGALAGAAGAAMGAGLASAISGATKLNELAGDYQVQTGANATEAKAFSGVLNDLFKNAHQSYDEIAATLIGLKTHFDLDGAAAKALAATILDFAEITGGTGADAVERLNSLVKTGVIAQSDMAATMDKLTIAHQTWGVNINETLDSLVKFAPAMNAFGMTTDQAIAWMSIFNKAGVDSQRVVMGFNTALQKVKTPAEFNALVAKIAATPDDLERAKLAVSLFGARAGGALANMLRPGTQSIADMAAVIGTDYTGAVEKAAAVNDSTFGGQALLMLHKFQGLLAGLGSNMGELLVAFALIGPRLTKVILAVGGGIGGLLVPKMAASLLAASGVQAWMTTGTQIGKVLGAAAGAAFGGASIAGISVEDLKTATNTFERKMMEAQAAKGGPGAEYAKKWLADASATLDAGVPLLASDIRRGMATGIAQMAADPSDPAGGGTAASQWIAMFAETVNGPRIPNAVKQGLSTGIMQGMSAGSQDLKAAAERAVAAVAGILRAGLNAPIPVDQLIATFGTGLQGVWDAAHKQGHATGVESMTAMAEGILAAEKAPLDAFTTMLALMKSELTPAAEAARLAGELTSKKLAEGLADERPGVAAQSIAAKEAILDRLVTIAKESGPLGKKAMDALAAGMKDADPTIRAYSKAAHDAVIEELNKTKADAYTAGGNAGRAFAAGILQAISSTGVTRYLSTGGTGKAGGLIYEPGKAAGGPVTAGMPYIVGEKRAELFIPETNGYILPSVPYVDREMLTYVDRGQSVMSAQPGGGRGAGAREQTINIANVTLGDHHDEFSLTQGLRFLASVG
jgi:hypothetical protein